MGRNGLKLFVTILINFFIMLLFFIIISIGTNIFLSCIIYVIFISIIIICRITKNKFKRICCILSSGIILLLLCGFLYIFTYYSRTYGFGYESYEEINMFSYNINISFYQITNSVIIIGLVGTVIDTAVSICSSMYEIFTNNKDLNSRKLFMSGMNIGRDILGTTVNTLLFAFLGEGITLLLLLYSCNYSLLELFNNKTLIIEFIKIMFSILGSLFVIPLSAFIFVNLVHRFDGEMNLNEYI